MSEPKETVVLCVRAQGDPLVPGSKTAPCSECGHAVWVSEGTFESIAGTPHRLICSVCAMKWMED